MQPPSSLHAPDGASHMAPPTLPPPGTQAFFPALLTHIHTVAPGVPLDPIIIQSVLLCLIAGDKNLVLRTHEEDVGLVARLAALTLTCIFAYPTHKLRVRRPSPNSPPVHPSVFLRSLFLPEEEGYLGNSVAEKKRHSTSTEKKQHSSSTDKLHRHSKGRSPSDHTNHPHIHSPLPPHSAPLQQSKPILLSSIGGTGTVHSESTAHLLAPSVVAPSGSSVFSVSTSYTGPKEAVSILRPSSPVSNPFGTTHAAAYGGHARPTTHGVFPRSSSPDTVAGTMSINTRPSRRARHAFWTDDEDGVTSSSLYHAPADLGRPTLQLPRALVVSGLEHTGVPSQRAFTEVLAAKRIVLDEAGEDENGGVWNLPDGYFVVYVCPLDPRERPAIHKSLLDRFAMSSMVSLQSSTRHALRSSRSLSYRNTPSPGFSSILSFPAITNPLVDTSVPVPVPKSLMLALRTLAHEHTFMDPKLSFYLSDLFTAVRHHPELDGTLLGARAHRDVDGLVRAGRVIGGDPTGAELLRAAVAIEDGSSGSYTTTNDDMDSEAEVANLLQSIEGYDDLVDDERRDGKKVNLDISDADIARIVPRVMSHRLRVRDGPRDELFASTTFGAVRKEDKGTEEGGTRESRSTIKEVIVRLLAEV